MKLIAVALSMVVAGCATSVPVTAKFPEPPGRQAMIPCPDLQKLEDGSRLSDVARTVTNNYTTYYGCAAKSDAWIEWYQIQREIFQNAK